jgi:hypothetical protein
MKNFMMLALAGAMFCGLVSACGETSQGMVIAPPSTTPSLNRQIKEEITAVWTQIANNFKDCGDWPMFEGFNELNDGGWGHSSAFKANPTLQSVYDSAPRFP